MMGRMRCAPAPISRKSTLGTQAQGRNVSICDATERLMPTALWIWPVGVANATISPRGRTKRVHHSTYEKP
jgi:hypothetical protein